MFIEIKHRIRLLIARHPFLILPILKMRSGGNKDGQVVNRRTDILAEGSGGSGNSFVFKTLMFSHKKSINISGHTHVPAQVIKAIQWGIPVLVLIREPIDSITSLASRNEKASIDEIESLVQHSLENYLNFYKSLLAYRHGFILANFREITNDYSGVIKRLNHKFNTQFIEFNYNKKPFQECLGFEKIVVKPNRKKLKDKIRKHLIESEQFPDLLKEAQSLYRLFN